VSKLTGGDLMEEFKIIGGRKVLIPDWWKIDLRREGKRWILTYEEGFHKLPQEKVESLKSLLPVLKASAKAKGDKIEEFKETQKGARWKLSSKELRNVADFISGEFLYFSRLSDVTLGELIHYAGVGKAVEITSKGEPREV